MDAKKSGKSVKDLPAVKNAKPQYLPGFQKENKYSTSSYKSQARSRKAQSEKLDGVSSLKASGDKASGHIPLGDEHDYGTLGRGPDASGHEIAANLSGSSKSMAVGHKFLKLHRPEGYLSLYDIDAKIEPKPHSQDDLNNDKKDI